MVDLINELKGFVEQQLEAEETGDLDWLEAHDRAFRWIDRLDENNLEVSPVVFLFLEETLHRRDPSFGRIRRGQMRAALTSQIAFPGSV
ncbi:hypothetical protein [Brevundimonas sp.]|uniref:hypothetical protein n=1 Tax=Brevundimonas sp. TaxID=1871086 RepID=UPI0028A27E74|nr:hypothetical protein [Brevundimonas sp.]